MIKETSYVDDINTTNNGVKIDVAYNPKDVKQKYLKTNSKNMNIPS